MKKTFLSGLFMVAASIVLVNCGSNGGGSSSSGGTTATTGLQTAYGCVQQCGTGMGLVNGQCVQVQITGGACTIAAVNGMCQSAGCAAGQVQTQYGCAIQNASCGQCGGTINGQCVQGYSNGGLNGGYNNGGIYNGGIYSGYPQGYNGGYSGYPYYYGGGGGGYYYYSMPRWY